MKDSKENRRPGDSEWRHAAVSNFAQMQKHQRDFLDWLLDTDKKEFLPKQQLHYVR